MPHTSHNTVQSMLCESNARGVLLDEVGICLEWEIKNADPLGRADLYLYKVNLFFQLRKFPLEEIFPNYNQSKEEKTT